MKTTKKLMALLLSVIMIVTFMPAMAFAGEITDESYDVDLFVNDNPGDTRIAPGDVANLQPKLFHRYKEDGVEKEEEVKDDVSFTVTVDENYKIDGHEQDPEPNKIFNIEGNTLTMDDSCWNQDGYWELTSVADKPEDSDVLFSGYAMFTIQAIYDEQTYSKKEDDKRSINVSCRIDYSNNNIMTGGEDFEDSSLLVSLPEINDNETIDINPICSTDKVTDYNLIIGKYEIEKDEGGFDHSVVVPDDTKNTNEYRTIEGTGTDAVLKLTKNNVLKIIDGTDPSFPVIVEAKGKVGEQDVVFARNIINVDVDDGRTGLFMNYRIEYPAAIPYVKGETEYPVVNEFHLISNTTNEELSEGSDTFEWRFVQVNPDLLPPEASDEEKEAADVRNGDKLTLDHLGKYWVVAAGLGDYRGFVIGSFELTDSEHFYKKKPQAKEELIFTDQEIPLVSVGAANGSDVVKYKMKEVGAGDYEDDYNTELPTAKEPGDYEVAFCISDGNNIYQEDSVRVRINRAPIDIELQNVEKTFGQDDPDYKTLIKSIKIGGEQKLVTDYSDNIKFTRESGEGANESGYRIYAHLDESMTDNYVAHVKTSKLVIHKAPYRLSVSNKVSFNTGNCTIPYYSDGESAHVEPYTGTADVLSAEVEDGNLKLSSNSAWSGSIKLVIDGDRNHVGKEG